MEHGPDFIVQARLRCLGTKGIVNNEEGQGGRNMCDEFREQRLLY